jgi:DNA-directed RNA polymerase subunit beta
MLRGSQTKATLQGTRYMSWNYRDDYKTIEFLNANAKKSEVVLEATGPAFSHYGRICPIATPEGPNIGLISSLCVFAKINDLGFIETPYRKVETGVVNLDDSNTVYLSAEEEEGQVIAQANAIIDDEGKFTSTRIKSRYEGDFPVSTPEEVHLMDVAPNQIASIAASLIPFLEHDDANRALMGSNMMRQAVPLLRAEAPIVGTGIERGVVRDSRVQIVAEREGVVDYVDANKIIVKYERTDDERFVSFDDDFKTYNLPKYRKTNQNTCLNLVPIVKKSCLAIKLLLFLAIIDITSSNRLDE